MFLPADMKSFEAGIVGGVVGVGEQGWKKVQDLATDDFIKASNSSDACYADLATLVQIINEKEENSAKLIFKIGHDDINVTFVCDDGHPFFVFCSGWASLSPLLTKVKYSLSCKVLTVGDICLVLRDRRKRKRPNTNKKDNSLCREIIVDLVDDEENENQPIDLSKNRKL